MDPGRTDPEPFNSNTMGASTGHPSGSTGVPSFLWGSCCSIFTFMCRFFL